MSDNSLDNIFEPLTAEEKAHNAAVAEIKDEVGRFKNKTQKQIRALKKSRRDENIPSKQASFDQQIAEKEQEFRDVDSVFDSAHSALKDRYKVIIKWDEIMRKHGVAGY